MYILQQKLVGIFKVVLLVLVFFIILNQHDSQLLFLDMSHYLLSKVGSNDPIKSYDFKISNSHLEPD